MPTLEIDGAVLAWDESGPSSSASPVLLLHGLGARASDWTFQIPVLAQRYRVIAVDLPGHGRSALPGERLTVDGIADRVGALLAHLAAPPVHVVGLSLGGCVALALTVRTPARVRSLTLVNSFARLRPARALARFDGRAQLAAVRCPTLLVVGARDATVPRSAAEMLRVRIAGARLVVVADSGHATTHDQPEALNHALLEFLATC